MNRPILRFVALIGIGAGLLFACTSAEVPSGGFACDDDRDCRQGLVCMATGDAGQMSCVAPASDTSGDTAVVDTTIEDTTVEDTTVEDTTVPELISGLWMGTFTDDDTIFLSITQAGSTVTARVGDTPDEFIEQRCEGTFDGVNFECDYAVLSSGLLIDIVITLEYRLVTLEGPVMNGTWFHTDLGTIGVTFVPHKVE